MANKNKKVTPMRVKTTKKKNVIEWTNVVWNPTTGCNKVSSGCRLCYAEVMAKRLKAMGKSKYSNGFKLTMHPSTLNDPYKWKRPKLVFVNSMSDIFHEDVTIEYIQAIFKVMNETTHHTYQILTKRAERLLELDSKGLLNWGNNIWMGVSVENNSKDVFDRIDYLSQTKAKNKFLSCEPLLSGLPKMDLENIDWVIVGGESGVGSRKIEKEWVLDIQEQCKVAGIPFFFKQWGIKKHNPISNDPTAIKCNKNYSKGGCQLDGQVYRAMPKKMRKVFKSKIIPKSSVKPKISNTTLENLPPRIFNIYDLVNKLNEINTSKIFYFYVLEYKGTSGIQIYRTDTNPTQVVMGLQYLPQKPAYFYEEISYMVNTLKDKIKYFKVENTVEIIKELSVISRILKKELVQSTNRLSEITNINGGNAA